MNGLYNVGSYVRLSKENIYSGSETIENQREMLSRFIAVMPGWIEQKCYIDNGFSGGTFDRPAFAEMISCRGPLTVIRKLPAPLRASGTHIGRASSIVIYRLRYSVVALWCVGV